jgi:hypothetical protein
MKLRSLFLLSLLVTVASTLGCASSEEQKTEISHELGRDVSEPTAKSEKDWSQVKSEFIGQSDERLRFINSDVNQLEKSKQKLGPKQKTPAITAIENTRSLLNEAREALGDLKKVDADEWETERLEFLSKMNELEERYASARSYYVN